MSESTSCQNESASPGSSTASPNEIAETGRILGPNRSRRRLVANIVGSAAAATKRSATPSSATDAPVCSLIAGKRTAQAPQNTPKAPKAESDPSRVTLRPGAPAQHGDSPRV